MWRKINQTLCKSLIVCRISDKYTKQIDSIPLSDTSVARRIKDMLHFLEEELIRRLKNSPHDFTLQLDESTDVAGLATSLAVVHYVFDSTLQDDVLLVNLFLAEQKVK